MHAKNSCSIQQQASTAGQENLKDIVAMAVQECLSRTQKPNVTSTTAENFAVTLPPNKPLTIRDTAAFFQVSIQTVHNWRKSGIIRSHKIGRRTYFLLEELQATFNKKKAA